MKMSHKGHYSKKSNSKKVHCDGNSEKLSEQLQEIEQQACSRYKNIKAGNLCVKGEAFFRGDVGIQGQLVVGG